jgi:threonine aldolase
MSMGIGVAERSWRYSASCDDPAPMPTRGFASDNSAGVHPEVLAALAAANEGHAYAYGDDPWTEEATGRLRDLLGAPEAEVLLVFNGTGGNVLALQAAARPFQAVICAESAHINVDECGAPERLAGCKLLPEPAPDGKLTPAAVRRRLVRIGDQHHVQPRVVSISQTTELGTVYSAGEIAELAELAHANGLVLHVDGARLANAAAALDVPARAITTDAGVDVLTFGGTKSGLLGAEAVVFLDPELAKDAVFLRKQSAQLASKMRFIAAQFTALLNDDLWLRNARHANAMAARLADRVAGVAGLEITQPVQANAVFARLPAPAIAQLRADTPFYVWDEASSEVRWMTAFDTTSQDVDRFAGDIADAVEGAR